MAVSIPATFADKWPLFTKNGLTRPCVYQEMGETAYVAGVASTPIISSHNVDIIFKAVSRNSFQIVLEDGSTIKSIDRAALFPVLLLPVVVKVNDLIVDPSLKEWKVKAIGDDPAGAGWNLWVRPIK